MQNVVRIGLGSKKRACQDAQSRGCKFPLLYKASKAGKATFKPFLPVSIEECIYLVASFFWLHTAAESFGPRGPISHSSAPHCGVLSHS